MREIYILILPAILLYVFVRALQDKNATFEKYIRQELQAKGLDFASSKPCENLDIPEVDKIPIITSRDKRRIGLGAMAGGFAALVDSTYKVIRKVGYKDSNGKLQEAYAAIEFSGFWFRRFLGISWNPEPK